MLAEMSIENWGAVAFMVVAGGWIIPVTVAALATNWRKARESEQLAVLKQSMIERGMSVDEIERVINAGMPGKKTVADKDATPVHE
jgi:hypothetical protein